MSFVKCLKFGKEGEEIAKKYFSNYDEVIDAPNKKFSEWDFGVRWSQLTKYFEVKRDTYTTKTGNMCIEFESNNIPSGISLTTAEYYIYLVEGEDSVYVIPTNVIKKMIDDKKYHRVQKGGYKFLSHFYLFKRELFSQYLLTTNITDINQLP
jgi:hypothetical protein